MTSYGEIGIAIISQVIKNHMYFFSFKEEGIVDRFQLAYETYTHKDNGIVGREENQQKNGRNLLLIVEVKNKPRTDISRASLHYVHL